MPNDSSTGGYLQPGASPAPLQGGALNDFLHDFIAGITGLDNTLIRPRWQPAPPNIPPAATAWCAFGIIKRRTDNFPLTQWNATVEQFGLQRYEELTVLASFYDLGESGQADTLAELLRDGMVIPQNLEPLQLAGFGLAYADDITPAPVLVKDRWQVRMDFQFTLRREINRAYPVLTVTSMTGTLITDSGFSEPIDATHP